MAIERAVIGPGRARCTDGKKDFRFTPFSSRGWQQLNRCIESNELFQARACKAAKSQSQTSRVPNVWPCHWLSKRRAKTKQVKSQSWAPLDAHYGWASFVADDTQSTDAGQRTSVDGRSQHHCLHGTGQAFHGRRLAQSGTRELPNVWGRIQTGLVGVEPQGGLQIIPGTYVQYPGLQGGGALGDA